jgi:hypothetical protein
MTHPIKSENDCLIESLSETCASLWRGYDTHMSLPREEPGWEGRASEIFNRGMDTEGELRQLTHAREWSRRLGERPGRLTPLQVMAVE